MMHIANDSHDHSYVMNAIDFQIGIPHEFYAQ